MASSYATCKLDKNRNRAHRSGSPPTARSYFLTDSDPILYTNDDPEASHPPTFSSSRYEIIPSGRGPSWPPTDQPECGLHVMGCPSSRGRPDRCWASPPQRSALWWWVCCPGPGTPSGPPWGPGEAGSDHSRTLTSPGRCPDWREE